MDATKTIKVGGKEYEFICRSWGTRSGFAHGVDMVDMENYTIVATNKCYYLNRTWESYSFQTAILGTIRNAIEAEKNEVRRVFMDLNGWKKITEKRREELESAFAEDLELKRLNTYMPRLKRAIRHG